MCMVNYLLCFAVVTQHIITVDYCNWLHLATCFGRYPAIIRLTRNSVIKVHSISFTNWIPLVKLIECTLITLFLVSLMMAG